MLFDTVKQLLLVREDKLCKFILAYVSRAKRCSLPFFATFVFHFLFASILHASFLSNVNLWVQAFLLTLDLSEVYYWIANRAWKNPCLVLALIYQSLSWKYSSKQKQIRKKPAHFNHTDYRNTQRYHTGDLPIYSCIYAVSCIYFSWLLPHL